MKKRGAGFWARRVVLGTFLFLFGVGGVTGFGIYLRYKQAAERFDLNWVSRLPGEVVVYDMNGIAFARFQGDGRVPVPLEQISPHFLNALVAREDTRFYQHGGIDVLGVMRATLRNVKDRQFSQGASTLTMQLARISFDLQEKTLHRKLIEAMLARRIEADYSKDEILHLYVNRVFLGTGMHGVQEAAQGYFGKSAADMNLGEAAMLAGIIRAPNRFSPFRHYEEALSERNAVLDRLVAEGMLQSEEAAVAKALPVAVRSQDGVPGREPLRISLEQDGYLVDAVRRSLGEILSEEERHAGGLDVYTTFDLELQGMAERQVETRLREIEAQSAYPHPKFDPDKVTRKDASAYLQAAVQLIENRTGEVRAMVGGRSYQDSRFNRALQSRRQIGSIVKPLVYAVAYESGIFPGTVIADTPVRNSEVPWDNSGWSPRNSDGRHLQPQVSEIGLIRSRNTMTVRVGERAGIEAVTQMIRQAGLGEIGAKERSPQLYVGNFGASLLAVTSAYSVFPNQGVRADPHWIQRIEDRQGRVIHEHPVRHHRVVSEGGSWMTSQILGKVMRTGGTAAEAREGLGIDYPAGGKTGTTNDYYDAWFVGYTSRLTAGVWVGLDQPGTIVDKGYGGRLALPIWADLMNAAHALGYRAGALPQPDEVLKIELCRASGQLSGPACSAEGGAYVESVPHALIPQERCAFHASEGLTETEGAEKGPGIMAKLKGFLEKK